MFIASAPDVLFCKSNFLHESFFSSFSLLTVCVWIFPHIILMKKLCVKCCWKWLQTNCRKNFSMRKSDSTEWSLSRHSSTVVWDGNFGWCFSLMIQRLEERPGSALRMKSNPILQSLYTTLTSSFQQKDLIVFNTYIFGWMDINSFVYSDR